jgi:hypothetical protein
MAQILVPGTLSRHRGFFWERFEQGSVAARLPEAVNKCDIVGPVALILPHRFA